MDTFEIFCKTGDRIQLFYIDDHSKDLLLQIAKKAFSYHSQKKGPYFYLAIDVIDILGKVDPLIFPCGGFKPLKWIGDSCYVDSDLIALLAIPNNFIQNSILDTVLTIDKPGKKTYVCHKFNGSQSESNIVDLENRRKVQTELIAISKSLRGTGPFVKNCDKLRKALVNCPHSENFHATGEKDASEYLEYILSMFPLTNTVCVETSTFTRSKKKWIKESSKISTSGIIWNVYSADLKESHDNCVIRKLLVSTVNISDKFKKTRTLISAPYIIFNLHRMDPIKFKFIDRSILPTQHVTVAKGQKFALSAIVVWEKSHYTSYIRCQNDWYYYDDTNSDMIRIGSYFDLIKVKKQDFPNVCTNGTMFFYIPQTIS